MADLAIAKLVILVSAETPSGLNPIARSTNLQLARHVIITLRDNRLLEDDEADVIYAPNFPVEADRMIACLTDQMRQNAAALFCGETVSEGDHQTD